MPTEREIQMLRAAREAGIASRAELANFMAQISAESRNLTRLEEGFAYTQGIDQIPPRWARRHGVEALENARLEALRGNAEPLAELMYGGRMGNNDPGDGYRYRGRGYIQLTGRDNYTAASRDLNIDLVGIPDLAAQPENAARIAVWYWRERVPSHQREDVLAATRRINGGEEGLSRRFAEFDRWNATLTPEFLADLDANRVIPDPRQAHGLIEDPTVRSFQQNLNALGVRDAEGQELIVDGNRGGPNSRTNQAVATFQRRFGLQGQMSNAELLSATQAALNARTQANSEQTLRGSPPDPRPLQSTPAPQPSRTHTSSPATPASLPPLPVTQPLQPGDRGAAVLALQAHLRLVGATDRNGGAIAPDRDYGPRTREAVEQFQLWTGRPTTGVADPDTLAALQDHARFAARRQARGIAPGTHLADNLEPVAPDPADAAEARTPQAGTAWQDPAAPDALEQGRMEHGRTIAAVQTGLIRLGYQHRIGQPLNVNGVNDEATRQAVTAFQAERNLPATGQPDAATRQALQQALAAQQQARQGASEGADCAGERMAASALVMARQMGFSEKDELHLFHNRSSEKYAAGELLHLARTGPTASVDPGANRIHMPTDEALSKPVEERYRQVQDIARQQELERQQALARGPDEPSRGGPVR